MSSDHILIADALSLHFDLGEGILAQEIRSRCPMWYLGTLIVVDKTMRPNGLFKCWYTPLFDISIETVAKGYQAILSFIRNEDSPIWASQIQTLQTDCFSNEIFKSISEEYGIEHIVANNIPLLRELIK